MKLALILGLGSLGVLGALLATPSADALLTPDWSEGARIPENGRANPYGVPDSALQSAIRSGRIHALEYPAEITLSLIPRDTVEDFFDRPSPFREFVTRLFLSFAPMRDADELFKWVGLHEYPESEGEGPYFVPYPRGTRPPYRMGYTLVPRHGAEGITISCANCHAANLFGRRVLGLTNRFPRSNEAILRGKQLTSRTSAAFFRLATGASAGDARIFEDTKKAMERVEAKRPQTLGLDTSLAQVALSLARREADDYATPSAHFERHPREEALSRFVADSKPGVWWNLKYKNRWLLDGSVVAGNPIYTNFLWNEIGRGTDLRELEGWFARNEQVIQDLTTAAFSARAPRYADFFSAESLPLDRARRGETVFRESCARCHGSYEKAWNQPGSELLPLAERLATVRVRYPERTPVIDVGTDPGRHQGMASLERVLNPLSISRNAGIVIRRQKGYVPPPLEGIWARWPYFHNNSVPSLCAVLTRSSQRPRDYWAGEALNPETDFDRDCNGYPSGARVPRQWKSDPDYRYDASKQGLSNAGHDEGIFLRDGQELLTSDQKRDLVVFLQTL